MKNILVLMGGQSTEHDISLITAIQTINNIDKTKHEIDALEKEFNTEARLLKAQKSAVPEEPVKAEKASGFKILAKMLGKKPLERERCHAISLKHPVRKKRNHRGLKRLQCPYHYRSCRDTVAVIIAKDYNLPASTNNIQNRLSRL